MSDERGRDRVLLTAAAHAIEELVLHSRATTDALDDFLAKPLSFCVVVPGEAPTTGPTFPVISGLELSPEDRAWVVATVREAVADNYTFD